MFGLFSLFFVFVTKSWVVHLRACFRFLSRKSAFSLISHFIWLILPFSHQKNVFCLFEASRPDVGLFYSKQCYRSLATKLGCFELYLTQHNVFTLFYPQPYLSENNAVSDMNYASSSFIAPEIVFACDQLENRFFPFFNQRRCWLWRVCGPGLWWS